MAPKELRGGDGGRRKLRERRAQGGTEEKRESEVRSSSVSRFARFFSSLARARVYVYLCPFSRVGVMYAEVREQPRTGYACWWADTHVTSSRAAQQQAHSRTKRGENRGGEEMRRKKRRDMEHIHRFLRVIFSTTQRSCRGSTDNCSVRTHTCTSRHAHQKRSTHCTQHVDMKGYSRSVNHGTGQLKEHPAWHPQSRRTARLVAHTHTHTRRKPSLHCRAAPSARPVLLRSPQSALCL